MSEVKILPEALKKMKKKGGPFTLFLLCQGG